MNNDVSIEFKKELSDPVEIVKTALKLAKDLYDKGDENSEVVTTIYQDIELIHTTLTSALPFNYVLMNAQVSARYESFPDVGRISLIRVSTEFLESQGDYENKRALALMAQSLQIMMTNIKVNRAATIVFSHVVEHSINAGVKALFKSDC